MVKEINEQWADTCKNLNQRMLDFANLNLETFNSITSHNGHAEELLNVKKPDEFMSAQLKLAYELNQQAMQYMQKAMEICMQASSEFNHDCTEMCSGLAAQSGKVFKTASKAESTRK